MSASKSLSPSSLIMQMNSAFPKDEKNSLNNNFQKQSGVMLLLVLAFFMFAICNSKKATIVLICALCLLVGYYYYTNNLSTAVDKFLELLGMSKKINSPANKVEDPKTPANQEKPDIEPVKNSLPQVLPSKIEPGEAMYKSETPVDSTERLEKQSKNSMYRDFHVIQPPVAALNAFRKSSYFPSTKRSVHEIPTSRPTLTDHWNKNGGIEAIHNHMKQSKQAFQKN